MKNLRIKEVKPVVSSYKARLEAIFKVIEHMFSLESIET